MVRKPWNKGFTKLTHPSLSKTSQTMASRPTSNFRNWELANPVNYKKIARNANTAEFYGVLLGDGCIEKLLRTEKLTLSFNSKEKERITRLEAIVERAFGKKPNIRARKTEKCTDIYLYQKYLSMRLEFPTGIKKYHELRIPSWIKRNRTFLARCLKGLFESDGSLCIDTKNNTCVIEYTSVNHTLLEDVHKALTEFGFNPQFRQRDIRLARKAEVAKFTKLISFSKD